MPLNAEFRFAENTVFHKNYVALELLVVLPGQKKKKRTILEIRGEKNAVPSCVFGDPSIRVNQYPVGESLKY